MYPDLLSRLRQDIRKTNRNEFYLICEHSLADGSFLLYHFISLYLRSPENGKVYILTLNQTISHYKIVLSKLGVQLQRHMDQDRIRILDFSRYLSLSDETATNEAPWFRFRDNDRMSFAKKDSTAAEEAMKRLYLFIKNEIENLMVSSDNNSTNQPPLLIVVDCISIFLDFRIPLKYVVHFIQYMRNLANSYDASIAFLVKTCDEFRPDVSDIPLFADYDRLATFLASWGAKSFDKTFLFDVRQLTTGWSKDIHGEVLIRQRKFPTSNEKEEDIAVGEMRLLYKLGDRNVTFMAPGLVPRIGV